MTLWTNSLRGGTEGSLAEITAARDTWHWPGSMEPMWPSPLSPWVTTTSILPIHLTLKHCFYTPPLSLLFLLLTPLPTLPLALVPTEHAFMCLKCRAQKIKVCVREIGGGEEELYVHVCECVGARCCWEALTGPDGQKKSWGGEGGTEIGGWGGGMEGL